MKFIGQLIVGIVAIIPIMTVGHVFRHIANAADRGADWLEGKIFEGDFQ